MTTTTPAGKSRLGPRIFAACAFAMGIAVLAVAYHEIGDQPLSPQNERFAPLVVGVMWVLFSGIYLARQLFAPHIDDPKSPAPEKTTDDTSAPSETGDDAEADDTDTGDDADEEALVADADADPTDVRRRTPLFLVLALVGYVVALEPLGFLLSTTVFFFGAAWIFGSRHYIRDLLIGAAIASTIYFSFTQLLLLYLPPGVLPV